MNIIVSGHSQYQPSDSTQEVAPRTDHQISSSSKEIGEVSQHERHTPARSAEFNLSEFSFPSSSVAVKLPKNDAPASELELDERSLGISISKVRAYGPKRIVGLETYSGFLGLPYTCSTSITADLSVGLINRAVLEIQSFELAKPSIANGEELSDQILNSITRHFIDEMNDFHPQKYPTDPSPDFLEQLTKEMLAKSWDEHFSMGLRNGAQPSDYIHLLDPKSPHVWVYERRSTEGITFTTQVNPAPDSVPAPFHLTAASAVPTLITKTNYVRSLGTAGFEVSFPIDYLREDRNRLTKILTVIETAVLSSGIEPLQKPGKDKPATSRKTFEERLVGGPKKPKRATKRAPTSKNKSQD